MKRPSPETGFQTVPFRMVFPAVLTVLLFVLTAFYLFLPEFERQLMARKRHTARHLTEAAWSALATFENEVREGIRTREEAQEEAVSFFRSLRYGDEMKDYFWINDLHPTIIMHPYRPDLNGQDVTGYADPNGKHLFVEFAEVCREKGGGYVDYMWQWKDDPTRIVPKISYVKLFEPWGWVIGTGIYIEDVRRDLVLVKRNLAATCLAILAVVTLLSAYTIWQGYQTERRRAEAEERRRKLEEKIEFAQRTESLGTLAGGIAHEFNNLLQGVLGNAEMALLDLSEDHPAREAVEGVRLSAERGAQISTQMLAYSGRGSFIIQPLNVSEIIRGMAHLLEVSVTARIRLEMDLAEDLPPVEGDAQQVRQLVMNLVSNAAEAIENGSGAVKLKTRRETVSQEQLAKSYGHEDAEPGQYVVIEIADNGRGMDAATLDRVFDPFFTTKFIGRGLGLPASFGIVRGHKGVLRIESQQGKGTTVLVMLPVLKE